MVVDVPGSRSAAEVDNADPEAFRRDRAYVEAQIVELIGACEGVTGVHFDIDRLREALACANRMHRAWQRVLAANRAVPAPFDAMSEATIYLGVANALRGTPEGARYMEDLAEEIEFKAKAGLGAVQDERHRLVFVGVPCYPIFRRFSELFSHSGGAFVSSSYLWFASGGLDLDFAQPLPILHDRQAVGGVVS